MKRVVVIGAGIVGAAVAFELASRGCRVTLVERSGVAAGASGNNAGILVPEAGEHVPRELSLFWQRSLESFPQLCDRVARVTGSHVDMHRLGRVVLFDDDASAATHAARQHASGIAAEHLGAGELARVAPQVARPSPAVFFPGHARIDALLLTHALIDGAIGLGATVHLNEQATRVDEIPGGQLIVTGWTSFEADAVVLCLGAQAASFRGAFVPPIHTVAGRIRIIVPPLPLTGPIITAPGIVPAIVPLPDGRVAIASTYEEAASHGDGEEELALLVSRAQELVPALTGAAELGTRRGERPFAPDHLPVIGATDPVGVFVAGGHGRMGVVSAPLTARVVADLVIGSHPAIDVAPFSPLRITASPAG